MRYKPGKGSSEKVREKGGGGCLPGYCRFARLFTLSHRPDTRSRLRVASEPSPTTISVVPSATTPPATSPSGTGMLSSRCGSELDGFPQSIVSGELASVHVVVVVVVIVRVLLVVVVVIVRVLLGLVVIHREECVVVVVVVIAVVVVVVVGVVAAYGVTINRASSTVYCWPTTGWSTGFSVVPSCF